MKKTAGRPQKEEKREPVSMKLPMDILIEIQALADVHYATKTKIIEECLKIGIPEFIKREKAQEKLKVYKEFHRIDEKKRTAA